MSFDTGRFDLTGFDVTGGMYRTIKATGLEKVDALIGSALIYHLLVIGNELVEKKTATGIQALAIAGSGTEEIAEGVYAASGNVVITPGQSVEQDQEYDFEG